MTSLVITEDSEQPLLRCSSIEAYSSSFAFIGRMIDYGYCFSGSFLELSLIEISFT